MEIQIASCSSFYFESVKKYIQTFHLDDRELRQEEFLVALCDNELVGFGRVREFESCSEMCSLGVISNKRFKGVGKALTLALAKKAKHAVFLVCIIPAFFEAVDFTVVESYPKELQQKLEYCTESLPVEEQHYVVMVLKR